MNELLYLSRSFVEFGPFPGAELLSFHSRGLLKESDYVRAEATEDWIHVNDWVAAKTATAEPAPKVTKTDAAPKKKAAAPAKKVAAVKKAAPAKKAAKKAP